MPDSEVVLGAEARLLHYDLDAIDFKSQKQTL